MEPVQGADRRCLILILAAEAERVTSVRHSAQIDKLKKRINGRSSTTGCWIVDPDFTCKNARRRGRF
ncbi:MAG: hypothetical protein ACLSH1_03880 [Clostridia bacterium]